MSNALQRLNAEVDRIEERAERRAAMKALPEIARALSSGVPDDAACFFKDGSAWCCVRGDFVNLQESPAGFGDTMEEALTALHAYIVGEKP